MRTEDGGGTVSNIQKIEKSSAEYIAMGIVFETTNEWGGQLGG